MYISVQLGFKLISLLVFTFSQVNHVRGKPNYEVILEQVITYDEYNLATIHYARMQRFNTSTRALNASFTIHRDMDTATVVKIAAFEEMPSGRYSMFPVKVIDMKVCAAMNDKIFYPHLLKCSNYPTDCPIKKGEYWVNNYIPDTNSMPDRMPGNRWKVVVIFTVKAKTIHRADIVFMFDRDSVF